MKLLKRVFLHSRREAIFVVKAGITVDTVSSLCYISPFSFIDWLMNKQPKGLFGQLAKVSIIGIEMVVSTFVGLAMGIYLDKWLETSPWLTILFLIFGIAAGFINIFREIRKIDD